MPLKKRKAARRVFKNVQPPAPPIPWPDPEPSGTLINTLDSAMWNINGGNATFDTGKIVFSGPSTALSGMQTNVRAGAYGITGIEKWKMTVEFVITNEDMVVDGGVSLFEIGIVGMSAYNSYRSFVRLSYANVNASYGRVQAYGQQSDAGSPSISSAASSITWTVGQTIRMTAEMSGGSLIGTVQNITTGGVIRSITQNYTFTTSGNSRMHNRGLFAIGNAGGAVEVTNIIVESTEIKNADLLVIGDSKTRGLYANGYTNRYVDLIRTESGANVVNHSGRSDETEISLAGLPQLITLNPKCVLMNIGCNDIRFGRLLAAYSADYAAIVSGLEAEGITVFHCLSAPDNIDVSPLNNFITTTYPAGKIVDLFNSVLNDGSGGLAGTYDGGDGVHFNGAGNVVVKDLIISTIGSQIFQ